MAAAGKMEEIKEIRELNFSPQPFSDSFEIPNTAIHSHAKIQNSPHDLLPKPVFTVEEIIGNKKILVKSRKNSDPKKPVLMMNRSQGTDTSNPSGEVEALFNTRSAAGVAAAL